MFISKLGQGGARDPQCLRRLLSPLPRSLLLLQGCPLEVLSTTHVRGGSVKSLPMCVGCVIGARLSYSLHISDIQGGEAHLVRFCH